MTLEEIKAKHLIDPIKRVDTRFKAHVGGYECTLNFTSGDKWTSFYDAKDREYLVRLSTDHSLTIQTESLGDVCLRTVK